MEIIFTDPIDLMDVDIDKISSNGTKLFYKTLLLMGFFNGYTSVEEIRENPQQIISALIYEDLMELNTCLPDEYYRKLNVINARILNSTNKWTQAPDALLDTLPAFSIDHLLENIDAFDTNLLKEIFKHRFSRKDI